MSKTNESKQMEDRLSAMFNALKSARREILPSKLWIELNQKNVEQLKTFGYDNFKRTVALNYFTWVPGLRDVQNKFLIRNLPKAAIIKNFIRSLLSRKHEYFSWRRSIYYNFITYNLWEYVSRQGNQDIMNNLEEPLEGNPPRVYLRDKLISQDLANSVLEFKSIVNAIDGKHIKTIMELGAGYGRTAQVFFAPNAQC